MNFFKTVAVVSAIAISSFSASAEQLSVGGITWDSSYVNPTDSIYDDFFAGGTYNETLTGNILSGYGDIATVNGTYADTFCVVAGCTLSYSFAGFTVTPDTVTAGAFVVNNSIATLDFTVTEASGATSTFLSLVGDGSPTYTSDDAEHSSVFSFFTVLETAGTAWKNFDTNSLAGDTDFAMLASRTVSTNPLTGVSQEVHGAIFKSNSVPAPTSLAIFGLALLGLAGAHRRKA
jgi:MYXO-CTERM domain-containing protein